jgi:hypothetical protein
MHRILTIKNEYICIRQEGEQMRLPPHGTSLSFKTAILIEDGNLVNVVWQSFADATELCNHAV